MLGAEPHHLHQLLDPALALVSGRDVVDGERLTEDRSDPASRVQRSVRILEDHLHVPAQRAHLATPELRDVLTFEYDLARRGGLKSRHETRERRLATAALSYETEGLTGTDLRGSPLRLRAPWSCPCPRPPPFTGKCLTTSLTSRRTSLRSTGVVTAGATAVTPSPISGAVIRLGYTRPG